MRHYFKLLLLLLTCYSQCNAQSSSQIFEVFPIATQINIQPFQNGIQMIEIDYIQTWENYTTILDIEQPISSSHRLHTPRPIMNTYLFRDETGNIFKAYNTNKDLKTLNIAFSNYPIDTIPTTQTTAPFRSWYNSDSPTFATQKTGEKLGYYLIYDSITPIPMDPFSFENSNTQSLIGLIDSCGNEILPPSYCNITLLPKGFVAVNAKNIGFLNYQLDTILPFEYTSYEKDKATNDFFFTKKEGIKTVYKSDKDEFYPVNYSRISWTKRLIKNPSVIDLRIGVATIAFKHHFIDSNYIRISNKTYDYVDSYWQFDFIRVFKNNKWGIVNQNGTEIIPCSYEDVWIVNKDSVLVKTDNNYYWMTEAQVKLDVCEKLPFKIIYDTRSKSFRRDNLWAIKADSPLIYSAIKKVNDSLFIIQKEQLKWGIVDANGTLMSKGYYSHIDPAYATNSNFILINEFTTKSNHVGFFDYSNSERLYGAISPSFQHFIPCVFQQLESRVFDGLILFKKQNKYGYMDTTGAVKISAKFDRAYSFQKGLGMVGTDSTFGFIDTLGKIIINPIYESVLLPNDGLFIVKYEGKSGVIDAAEKIKIPFKYGRMHFLTDQLIKTERNNKWGILNRKGKIIIPFNYDGISHLLWDKYIQVNVANKYGVIDLKGREVVPCIYDQIITSSRDNDNNYKLKVKDGNQTHWVDFPK